MSKSKPATNPLNLGRPDTSGPQYRMLQGVHENFSRALASGLTTFLQSEIQVDLKQVSCLPAREFQKTLRAPACLIRLRLVPRDESIVVHLSPGVVFGLLELLLGGSGGSGEAENRALTEIEWSLLEEVVRVMVRALGEAWQTLHQVEFKVESLENDPAMLPAQDPAEQLVLIRLNIGLSGTSGEIAIAVPKVFFDSAAPAVVIKEIPPAAPPEEDILRNLALLEDAPVDLEVSLEGPTMEFRELMALTPGQVVRFNYSLRKPVRALVNDTLAMTGHVVSAGRKRAFQIERLPN